MRDICARLDLFSHAQAGIWSDTCFCGPGASSIGEAVDINDVSVSPSNSSSFEGLPSEWQIPLDRVKLVCVDNSPRELGKGGFGVVYEAIVRNEPAAIKMVSGSESKAQARLLHEITVQEKCKSMHTVHFLGYSIAGPRLLLCMELMEGGSLYNSLRQSDEFQWYNRSVITSMVQILRLLQLWKRLKPLYTLQHTASSVKFSVRQRLTGKEHRWMRYSSLSMPSRHLSEFVKGKIPLSTPSWSWPRNLFIYHIGIVDSYAADTLIMFRSTRGSQAMHLRPNCWNVYMQRQPSMCYSRTMRHSPDPPASDWAWLQRKGSNACCDSWALMVAWTRCGPFGPEDTKFAHYIRQEGQDCWFWLGQGGCRTHCKYYYSNGKLRLDGTRAHSSRQSGACKWPLVTFHYFLWGMQTQISRLYPIVGGLSATYHTGWSSAASFWNNKSTTLFQVQVESDWHSNLDWLMRLCKGNFVVWDRSRMSHMSQVCTLNHPTRAIVVEDMVAGRDAPEEMIKLIAACRREDPDERPKIDQVYKWLSSITWQLSSEDLNYCESWLSVISSCLWLQNMVTKSSFGELSVGNSGNINFLVWWTKSDDHSWGHVKQLI